MRYKVYDTVRQKYITDDQELKQRYDTTLRYHTQFSTPTAEELERRDKFFHQLHEELSCKMDGPDLIEEIPDIDLEE